MYAVRFAVLDRNSVVRLLQAVSGWSPTVSEESLRLKRRREPIKLKNAILSQSTLPYLLLRRKVVGCLRHAEA